MCAHVCGVIEKMRILFLSLVLTIVSGCSEPVLNPKSEQIEGDWEHVHFVYIRLQLDVNGNGVAVLPNSEGESIVLEISDFVSAKSSFDVNVKELAELDSEKTAFQGILYQSGVLCFDEYVEDEKDVDGTVGDEMCFSRVTEVNSFRKKAIEVLKDLNNKKPNGTSASDAFSMRPLAGR